jgi:hypothetical protein
MTTNRNSSFARSGFLAFLCLFLFIGASAAWVVPPALPLGSASTPRVTSTFDRPPPPTPRFTPFPRPTPQR